MSPSRPQSHRSTAQASSILSCLHQIHLCLLPHCSPPPQLFWPRSPTASMLPGHAWWSLLRPPLIGPLYVPLGNTCFVFHSVSKVPRCSGLLASLLPRSLPIAPTSPHWAPSGSFLEPCSPGERHPPSLMSRGLPGSPTGNSHVSIPSLDFSPELDISAWML